MDPLFLDLDEVVEIHQDQLRRYGGQDGIRDVGLLISALGQPQATWGGRFLHGDSCAMAAAYLFHLVQNHPFLDGNNRTGTMAAFVFLALNGWDLAVPEAALEALVWRIARGEIDVLGVAEAMRPQVRRLEDGV